MKLSDCLTKMYLQKLDSLQINMKYKLKTGFFGMRKASGKGNSIEFSDFRQYYPGDDSRRIDWNSYARFEKLFVKQYAEERQANVNIFIDTSRSMDFGEGVENKLLFSKILAASIAYIGLSGGERVNLFSFSESLICHLRGQTTKRSFTKIAELLENIEASGRTSQSKSFEKLPAQKIGNGMSIVISDFFSQDGYENLSKSLLSQNQQPVFAQILTRDEVSPATGEKLKMIDSETNESMEVALDSTAVSVYGKALAEYRDKLDKYCSSRGFRFVFSRTDENPLNILSKITGCV